MVFATAAQLATRLGRTFTAAEQAQAEAILADATAYLQAATGQLIEAGTATVTFQHDPGEARIRLPQWPVTAVTTVKVNGTPVTDAELRDGHLYRWGWPAGTGSQFSEVEVTFGYGHTTVPAELTLWACVLAAGALAQSARAGTLGGSGVSSERIDDYAVNYEPGSVAMSLPARVLERLRARYGGGADIVSPA